MKQLKFVVDKCSGAASRLGQLELQRPNNGNSSSVYPTPMFFIHTLAGSVPHITSEVFDMIYPDPGTKPPIQISIDTTYTFHEAVGRSNGNISKFVGLENSPCLLTLLNPAENFLTGFNDKNGISIWPRTGRKSVDIAKFCTILSDFQPTAYQCLHDYDVNSGTLEKRLKKSTTRAVDYLNHVLTTTTTNLNKESSSSASSSSGVLVPLEPAWFHVNEKEGERTLAALLEKREEFQGFLFKVNYEEPLGFLSLYRKIAPKLPADKFKYVSGVCTLREIIDLVLEGVDAFDSSIVTQLADDKKALVLPFDNGSGVRSEDLSSKEANNHNSSGEDVTADKPINSLILDLKDKKYFNDFRPLSSNCNCATCRKHTRSYIHHLHVTNELLGYVLLMVHNLTSFDRFFQILRSCLRSEDNSQLAELKKAVTVSADDDKTKTKSKKENSSPKSEPGNQENEKKYNRI